ncbi:MAG: lipoyl synthase [Candidatus Eisenbacteria bacterium]|nr:lipoyl synthase [Candidatus Eisenbacteria bacterium]
MQSGDRLRERPRLPSWLTKPLSDPARVRAVRQTLARCHLNTVCDEAKCPNRVDCFTRGTATFMVLGDACTRDCRFCAVRHTTPVSVDDDEPERVAEAARLLGLSFVVLTSVTRDDLPDGGAGHFAATVDAVRRALPQAGIEVLVPDFHGSRESIDRVLDPGPDVFGHNVETVSRLYAAARPEADYARTLSVLRYVAEMPHAPIVKSAMMLGLGETTSEIESTLRDLRTAGVEILCLGQYLSPSDVHLPVERFVPPEEFDQLADLARDMGFAAVASGPFVRSSYLADESAARARDERTTQTTFARRKEHA